MQQAHTISPWRLLPFALTALLILSACGSKPDSKAHAVPTISTQKPTDLKGEETLSIDVEAPPVTAPHGGFLFHAGGAMLELVLAPDIQRLYLLDKAGQPVKPPDDCIRFSLMMESGDVADFRRKEGIFETRELGAAASDGLKGRLFFAQCPIEGVSSVPVEINPDVQRFAAHGGRIFYLSNIIVEVASEPDTLKLWVSSRETPQGPAVQIRSVSLTDAGGADIPLKPAGKAAFTAVRPESGTDGVITVGTARESVSIEVGWE